MFRPLVFAGAALLVGIAAGRAPAQQSPTAQKSPAAALKEAGVTTSLEGVRDYLRELTEGKYAPPGDKEAAALIGDLGHKQFKVREAASKRLAEMQAPPVDRLREAARSGDAEIARRATALL